MWTEINGERKKIACGPCIRGHRSSKCDHRDRVLLEVRKPGRPLSSCPHPSGSCSCERVVINYTIPKTSECACPSDRPVLSSTSTLSSATGNRVRKSRNKKSISTVNPISVERALKASQNSEADVSLQYSSAQTDSSLSPSEKSSSNGVSPSSSTSSTPRMGPMSPDEQSYNFDMPTPVPAKPEVKKEASGCCKSQIVRRGSKQVKSSAGGCCGKKVAEPQQAPVERSSCCSGPKQNIQPEVVVGNQRLFPKPDGYVNTRFNNQFQMQNNNLHPMPSQLAYIQNQTAFTPGNVPISNTYANAPVMYGQNGMYHQPLPLAPAHMHHGPTAANGHASDHSCHCGDGCSCFGCADHPYNTTMTQYVQSMAQYMSTGNYGALPPPTYDVLAYSNQHASRPPNHHLGFMQPPQSLGYPNLVHGSKSYPLGMANTVPLPGPQNSQNFWQQSHAPTPVQSAPRRTFEEFNWNVRAQSLKSPETKPEEPLTSPAEEKDGEETSTLSPSNFHWQELLLPGCNDATGTCQCGDGCECVGCLTHGGHTGVPLELPSAMEQTDLSPFLNGSYSTGSVQQGHFATNTFAEAPT